MDARDNNVLSDWEKQPCPHCEEHRTYQGHDRCLGELDGVANACCGHGGKGLMPYVQFWDGTGIWGEDAIEIQKILKRNKNNNTLEDRIKFLKKAVSFLEENMFSQFIKFEKSENKEI